MKIPDKTIPDLMFEGLAKYDGSCFSSTKRDGKWVEESVDSFKKRVRFFCLGLHHLGVKRGDKVSLHAENSTEWLLCDLAILCLGAVNVPTYSTQPGDQIKYILEDCDSVAHIVSNDEMFADTKPLIKSVKSVKAVISIFGSKHGKLKSFEDILEQGKEVDSESPSLFEELLNQVEPDDLATLIYTSGTTGLPKGVMLTHHNISSNVLGSMKKLPYEEQAFCNVNVLSYLPLSHVFERMIDYMFIYMGSKIHYIDQVDEIRDDFLTVNPFFMATVPRLLEKIHTGVKVKGQELTGLKKSLYYWAIYLTEEYDPEHPPTGIAKLKHSIADKLVYKKIRSLFGNNLGGMVSGGAALSPDVFRFMNAIGILCVQGYGLSETSPVITVQTPGDMRVGSSGKPLKGVDVKIADDGEILAKGPNIMKGYYNDEEKTNEVLTDDGWFKTGDIGKIDDDGYLYITDRKKSMFKLSTGKYVAPQNIENKLTGSGFIDQVVVIGYQRKFCSALIVPSYDNIKKRLKRDNYEPEEPLSEDSRIRELINKEIEKTNKQLSPWEKVKKFELLEDPLTIDGGELTPTMKVKRPVVLEKFQDKIESMYKEE
jgi:long-chain acyl-CoA synthetase